jgi:hypothetical protein
MWIQKGICSSLALWRVQECDIIYITNGKIKNEKLFLLIEDEMHDLF